ncbi:hypothetical protein FC093_21100 [Ilyomonas limi]|uniref:Phosphoribosylpyrophosphate synthetase n=1 Tax=Ilyomonas limi TaxID=2575867 RepID=A0A4U3KU14_9BACT|nr:hypothetical protein [Ilyomonas limi]TKK65004.1 hypothetical protein FC093_21100 [Ilyomonas limi]
MNEKFKYGTTSEAIAKLRASGFDKDFTLKDGFIWCGAEKFEAEDLKIASVNRYEGASDPGDEATVYGLETKTGLKGILVKGDGIYSDTNTIAILQKLHRAKLDNYSNKSEDQQQ